MGTKHLNSVTALNLLVGLVLAAGALAQGGGPAEWKAPGYATRKVNRVVAAAEAVTAGKALFLNLCAACHGNEGRGNGPAAVALQPKPRDLTQGEWYRQTDGALFWKIRTGRAPMPAFSAAMTETQIWQVVHFLRSIQPQEVSVPIRLPKHRVSDAVRHRVSASLARYFELLDVLRNRDQSELADARAKLQKSVGQLAKSRVGIEGTALVQWQRDTKALVEVLSKAPIDAELDLQRTTEQMTRLLSGFGHDEQKPVWLLCWPKARGGKGGQWLQLSPAPDNPFGGSADRKRGTATAKFAASNTPNQKTDEGASK